MNASDSPGSATTRRGFLRSAALGAAAVALRPGAAAASATERAVPPVHRNLFNGDTCVYFYNPELWQPEGGPFSARAIHRYVANLAANGIDTFLINANASKAWYPSKVVPTILDGYRRGDREFFRGHAICAGATDPADVEAYLDHSVVFFNRYLDLIDAGVDWLAETSVACRRHGVTPWVSIRMNDMHGHRNFPGSFFNNALLKRPEMRLHHNLYPGMTGESSDKEGMNYEKPEVRDFMSVQIRDVVENYDFEGLELDWLRNPLCCNPTSSAATVGMMSDWIREIREMTRRRAARNGRPCFLGMRVPGRLETMRTIGVDLAALCRDGTLDFINPSGFWRTTWTMPHDDWRRALGERVRIYGVIEDGANALPTYSPTAKVTRPIRYISASQEMLRANAAGKLVLGADGIEWFNFFCTDQAAVPGVASVYRYLRGIDRLDLLRGREKHYALEDDSRQLDEPPFDLPAQIPAVLEPHRRQPFRLPLCAEPEGAGLEAVVQVVLKKDGATPLMPVSINGCWPKADCQPTDQLLFPCGSLTTHTPDHIGCNYTFPISLLRDGWNEILVENATERQITLAGLELAVKRA